MTRIGLFVLSLVAIGIAYGPLLAEYGARLWSRPHYQHFPFVILASFVLFATQLGAAEKRTKPASPLAAPWPGTSSPG